jgi:uncharacterized membrane protein YoaK (UPF0700 family)
MESRLRLIERDVLLFVLAVSAGSADGWCYFGLGHAFVANMTGNTVLLGMSVFQGQGDVFHLIIAMSCYAVGVMIASLLTRNVQAESIWPRAVSSVLLLEALLITVAEVGWATMHVRSIDSPLGLNLLLGCVALAIGLQSGAMLQLKIPGIVTTYITGTWTTLMRGLVRVKSQPPGQRRQYEDRLLMQAGLLVVYFLSAVATGWLFRHMPATVGALTASSVLFAAIYGRVRPLETESAQSEED